MPHALELVPGPPDRTSPGSAAIRSEGHWKLARGDTEGAAGQ